MALRSQEGIPKTIPKASNPEEPDRSCMVFLWPSPRRHMVSLPSKNFLLSESRFPWEIQENTDPTYQWEKLPRTGRGQFLTCHIFLFSTLKSNKLTTASVCWNCLEAFCNQVRTFFQSQLLEVWPSQSQKIRFLISSQLEVNSSCFKKGCVYSLNRGFKFFPLRLFFFPVTLGGENYV